MDRSLDFTFDPQQFATLPDMMKDLHSHGQRYVMILVFILVYLADNAYLFQAVSALDFALCNVYVFFPISAISRAFVVMFPN